MAITVELRDVERALAHLAKKVAKDLKMIVLDEMSEAAQYAQDFADRERKLGAGDPAHYRDSFVYIQTSDRGLLTNVSPYAEVIEYGAPPHFPPHQPIKDWLQAAYGLSEAEAEAAVRSVVKTIGRRGIRPTWILRRTMRKVHREIRKRIRLYAKTHQLAITPAARSLRATYGR